MLSDTSLPEESPCLFGRTDMTSEMMDWLTDELKYRVRTVAAHAYCRGKNREGPDTAFTEQEIMRGVERIRLRLEAEDEFIWKD